MTSEVVVMNRLGVALASDSAATVQVGGGHSKMYHADKLFMLSQVHPVGAMVYNNSALMGIPWETILKLYRKNLDSQSFPTLEEYGKHLMGFLNSPPKNLFDARAEDSHYLEMLQAFYEGIDAEIVARKREEMQDQTEQKDEDEVTKRISTEVIEATLAEWRSKEDAPEFVEIAGEFAGRLSPQINQMAKDVFAHRRLGAELQALQELAKLVIAKDDLLPHATTGIVIAGFGDDDYVPALAEYTLGEVYAGKLKWKTGIRVGVDTSNPSVVKAFAEERVVQAYLDGIDPDFELKIISDVAGIMLDVPNAVIDSLQKLSAEEKEKLKAKVKVGAEQLLVDWADELKEQRRETSNSFLRSISFLPKDELAHVAQSLVSMTSFQKRMAIDEEETVGGPIDVAVISKCDGFVWIKRKHYFPKELNRHFFKTH